MGAGGGFGGGGGGGEVLGGEFIGGLGGEGGGGGEGGRGGLRAGAIWYEIVSSDGQRIRGEAGSLST